MKQRNKPCLAVLNNIGSYAEVVQYCSNSLTNIIDTSPIMIAVTQGIKKIQTISGENLQIKAGQIGILPANLMVTIHNVPDSLGEYRAFWFKWDSKVIDEFFHRYVSQQTQPITATKTIKVLNNIPPAFFETLRYTATAFNEKEKNSCIVQHRLTEILLWLQQFQVVFPVNQIEPLQIKVRQIVSQNPAQLWLIQDIASRLAMSEATLRRHLSKENTSFSMLLTDIRMCHGLTLLQSTSWSLERIAQESGYKSGSRFMQRFYQRFNITPKAIRQSK